MDVGERFSKWGVGFCFPCIFCRTSDVLCWFLGRSHSPWWALRSKNREVFIMDRQMFHLFFLFCFFLRCLDESARLIVDFCGF